MSIFYFYRNELHLKLISTIALEYLHSSVRDGLDRRKFLLNCRKYLTTPRERSIEDVVEVFDLLESKGLMSPGNYSILRELVWDISVDLVRIIEETEAEMGRIEVNRAAQAAMHDESDDCG